MTAAAVIQRLVHSMLPLLRGIAGRSTIARRNLSGRRP
jgi:hypothetical protein